MLNPDERRQRLRMMIIFLIILACVLAFVYDVERPHFGPDAGAVSEVHSLGWTVVAAKTGGLNGSMQHWHGVY
jgi:hypothetical protein